MIEVEAYSLLIGRRQFVVVNGRTSRPQSFCAWCCEPIRENYLRELTTHLSYCDHDCYVGQADRMLQRHGEFSCNQAGRTVATSAPGPM